MFKTSKISRGGRAVLEIVLNLLLFELVGLVVWLVVVLPFSCSPIPNLSSTALCLVHSYGNTMGNGEGEDQSFVILPFFQKPKESLSFE